MNNKDAVAPSWYQANIYDALGEFKKHTWIEQHREPTPEELIHAGAMWRDAANAEIRARKGSEAPVQPDGDALLQSLKDHRLTHDKPSQLADAFRNGWRACLSQSAQPSDKTMAYAIKVQAYGGSTGINDYLMSDGSVKAMRPSEVVWANKPSSQAVAPAQAMQQITGDMMRDRFFARCKQLGVTDDDNTQMRFGWFTSGVEFVEEVYRKAAPQPNQDQSGTDTQARDDVIDECKHAIAVMEAWGPGSINRHTALDVLSKLKGSK